MTPSFGPRRVPITVLCAEIPCTAGDETWNAHPETVAATVLDGMARCDMAIPRVEHVELRHLPSVYPVITAAAPSSREDVLATAESIDGVTMLGRQGLIVADNVHHVLDMALAAVDCFDADSSWPQPQWNEHRWSEQRRRFDSFVVED